jgi:hypothetical protein
VVYRYQRDGIRPESLTSFCVDVGQRLWEEQHRGGIEWFPPEWTSKADPTTFARPMRIPVADRVRGLGGAELRKVLQIAGKSSA